MLPTANNPIVTMTGSLSEDTLKTLMLRSLEGDEGAYRHLLHALRRLLTAYYGRRMGAASRAEVEDLVQETLLSLHAKRATYDRSRPFTAWFFSIARYKLIDHYRGRGARMRGRWSWMRPWRRIGLSTPSPRGWMSNGCSRICRSGNASSFAA